MSIINTHQYSISILIIKCNIIKLLIIEPTNAIRAFALEKAGERSIN